MIQFVLKIDYNEFDVFFYGYINLNKSGFVKFK